MTLEEAILYCEEVAEINQSIADNTDHNNWMDIAKCEKCAYEHRQVAEWLRELKQHREQPEIVRCKDCKYWHREIYNGIEYFNFSSCNLNHCGDGHNFYCADAERRTDG